MQKAEDVGIRAAARALAPRRCAHAHQPAIMTWVVSAGRPGVSPSTMAAPAGANGVERTLLAELRPGDKNVTCTLVLVERLGGTRSLATKDGHKVSAFRAADESAAVELAVWDRPGEVFAPGDVVVLRGGYASLYRTKLVLYVGTHGTCLRKHRAPTLFKLVPDMSSPQIVWVYDDASKRWQQGGERSGTDAASVIAHLALRKQRAPAPPIADAREKPSSTALTAGNTGRGSGSTQRGAPRGSERSAAGRGAVRPPQPGAGLPMALPQPSAASGVKRARAVSESQLT